MTATLMIVDVDQGDCTIAVDSETKRALLVDCNRGHHQQAIAALQSLGFTELCAAVVTHSHSDHFGGVLDVLEELHERFTGVLFLNHDTLLAMPGTTKNKNILRAVLTRALELGDRVSRAHADLGTQTLGTTTWTLLAPSYPQLLRAVAAGQPNLASGIVLIESEGKSVIVGGDAQIDAWKDAESRLPTGSIVRWPHHGGEISRSRGAHQSLLQLLDPTAVLISVGARNRYSQPSNEFFEAIKDHGGQLLCTQATAKCTAGGAGKVCAGSIRVALTTGSSPQPQTSTPDHKTFVQGLGSAQCIEG